MKKDIKQYLQSFENKEGLRLFFSLLEELISNLKLEASNEKLAINWRDDLKRIHVSLNSRLVFGITNKADFIFMANNEDYAELSEKIHFIKQEKFDMQKPDANLLYIDYKQFTNNLPLIKSLWLKSCKEYEPIQDKSQYKPYHIDELFEITMDETKLDDILNAKNPKILDLIERYKNHIQEEGLSEELFKWERLNKFQGKLNVESIDFQSNIRSINFGFLIFAAGIGVIHQLSRKKTEEYVQCLKELFNDEIDLTSRINKFKSSVEILYREIEPNIKLSSHHDERTISTLLTFHNPEKYTFFKDTIYQEYCKYLHIEAKKGAEKYAHFLELISDIANNYVLKDNELKVLIDNNLQNGDYYKDKTKILLAQDILYQMINSLTKYWVFQGNPKYYRVVDALNDGVLNDWLVTRYKSEIKAGDKVILWLTGDNPGIYALATITSSVKVSQDDESDLEYYLEQPDKKEKSYVEISIDFNLSGEPIFKKEILSIPELKDLNQGRQGTNFTATELQYKTLLNLITMQPPLNHIQNQPLNQILYGPPGTGKTYSTINKAIAIVNPDFNLEQPRELIKNEYKRLVDAGQIVFTTFHQSMSYEDFIEGIKPETLENEVIYEIKSGIFKLLCEQAKAKSISGDNFDQIYQKLLNDINENDKKLILESIVHAKEFTIYVNSKNNLRFHANTEKHYEGVLKKDVIEHYLKTGETLDWPSYVKAVGAYLVSNYKYTKNEEDEHKNYVLIIDEINRGNVSQIFGELITLIEDDKRIGNTESLEVTLPYSKEKFGVPSNLYIIGTMNTADRSVEALDAALRRRFSFEEIPSKPELIATVGKTKNGELGEINLVELLETINKRIEVLLDKDHQIGHSYFLSVSNIQDLKKAFQCKIIPLLQEYFFGDYGKIGLVLGSGFVVTTEKENGKLFANFSKEYDASDYAERIVYRIENVEQMQELEFILAILTLLNK